ALLVLRLGPALHRRQPEHEREEAARQDLVRALVEDGRSVDAGRRAVRPLLEAQSRQQHQVEHQQSPDDVYEPVQRLPVPAEPPLRRVVAREEERDEDHHVHEPDQKERVPGEPAEHSPGKACCNGRDGGIGERGKRHQNAIPAPERYEPALPGHGDQRGDEQGAEQEYLGAAPEDVGFRGVQRSPVPGYDGPAREEYREERGSAKDTKRDYLSLDVPSEQPDFLVHPGIYRGSPGPGRYGSGRGAVSDRSHRALSFPAGLRFAPLAG